MDEAKQLEGIRSELARADWRAGPIEIRFDMVQWKHDPDWARRLQMTLLASAQQHRLSVVLDSDMEMREMVFRIRPASTAADVGLFASKWERAKTKGHYHSHMRLVRGERIELSNC